MTDYLGASLNEEIKGGLPLTSNSTPRDADGAVEILRLVGDPSAHKKRLGELQQAVAEADRRIAEATRREIALAKQVEEMAKIRAEFDRQLEVDRRNHVEKTKKAEAALAAKCEQFAAVLDNAMTWATNAD